jgi:FemAB-related protein (PEP-CTERM system-associated)
MSAAPLSRVHVGRALDTRPGGVWARTVEALGSAHLAHAPEWFEVIRQAYGHDPLYLAASDDGGRAVLPAFVVRRPLLGPVVSSMPFLDGGGPASASASLGDALVARLVEEARVLGARAVELRTAARLGLPWTPLEHKVNLTRVLPADPDLLWRQLDGRVRNQVRKAERSGFATRLGGEELLDAFYGVFAARMHELGSPVHGRAFFAAVLQAFAGRARVAVVLRGDRPAGGLIALSFKDTLTVPWAACRREHAPECPNMQLYWEAIRTACREGFRRFDFGRSTRGSGTYRFKRQWGAEEQPLLWYTIPTAPRHSSPSTAPRHPALLAGSWRRLPLALTRRLGPRVRRYLTQ